LIYNLLNYNENLPYSEKYLYLLWAKNFRNGH
jgi:hypothetical protein